VKQLQIISTRTQNVSYSYI